MKTAFRVVPLPTEVAEAARKAAKAGHSDHRTLVVDSPQSAPCRHCLRWAQPGERVVLFPYNAVPAGHPYSETGPIFVHADECRRYEDEQAYPAEFRSGRVFRGYSATNDLTDAILPNGEAPEAVIEKLLENPEITSVHIRSATRGCFTFKVERQ